MELRLLQVLLLLVLNYQLGSLLILIHLSSAVLDGQNSISNRNSVALQDMATAMSEAGTVASSYNVKLNVFAKSLIIEIGLRSFSVPSTNSVMEALALIRILRQSWRSYG